MHDKSDTFQTKVCLNNINVTDSTCWLAIIYILPVHSCMSVCRLQGGMVLICFVESYGLPCLQRGSLYSNLHQHLRSTSGYPITSVHDMGIGPNPTQLGSFVAPIDDSKGLGFLLYVDFWLVRSRNLIVISFHLH